MTDSSLPVVDSERLRAAYQKVRDELLAERTPDGHWVGELSPSALSTATAVGALSVVKAATSGRGTQIPRDVDDLIHRGVTWLVRQQNPDGGFGDTDLSHSNIATTMLVVAALHLAGVVGECHDLIDRANTYVDAKGRLDGLRERYGIDKTFVVPIMTNLALAGLVDWRDVDPLPFELACVPQAWYRFVGMPVVSYAIPALVAIGQARYFHAPPRNPITRLIRRLSIGRSLKVLRRMQPDSGGYLEATPLTSFVVMSLASMTKPRPVAAVYDQTGADAPSDVVAEQDPYTAPNGRGFADDVIREGVKFLIKSVRPDGSWPIDTNLATWNTTLAINALAGAGEDVAMLLGVMPGERAVGNALRGVPGVDVEAQPAARGTAQRPFPTGNVLDWLLACQHAKRHPFTAADPGGFGWSDLSGAVPDADDTAGALLALDAWRKSAHCTRSEKERIEESALKASVWGSRLWNSDGGMPTFCRGWGRLPFDRSGTDLSAHSLRAAAKWPMEEDRIALLPEDEAAEFKIPKHATGYLEAHQHSNGSWSPLWFGNQDHPNEKNPVYGTAKVLMAYRDLGLMDSPQAQRGVAWLVANQNEDGGWGSGVWGRIQHSECKMQNEEHARCAELGARLELASLGEPLRSTEYSVQSTPTPTPTISNPKFQIPDPKSQIRHLKSSIEETSLAIEALLAACPPTPDPRSPTPAVAAAARGLTWLLDRVEQGQHRQPAPIGFYFAKLWYYERLYPLIFATAALGRACRQFARPAKAASTDEPSESRAR